MRLSGRPSPSPKPTTKAGMRLRAVRILSLGEVEFAEEVAAAERHPAFAGLRPYIRRRNSFSRSFYLPPSDREAGSSDPISWSDHARELELIRRIGQTAFEKYFLFEESGLSTENVAAACGLTAKEARVIQAFLLTAALHTQNRSITASAHLRLATTCIGRVSVIKGQAALQWTLPHLARGVYEIDYAGVASLQASLPSALERRQLRQLLGALEALNLRQKALSRALQVILEQQRRFLETGRRSDLSPLAPSRLAAQLRVHPSTVGRLAENRSIVTPWGEELALRTLMPNRRRCAIYGLQEILGDRTALASDAELQRRLKAEFRIALSRRSINEYRHAALRAD